MVQLLPLIEVNCSVSKQITRNFPENNYNFISVPAKPIFKAVTKNSNSPNNRKNNQTPKKKKN